LQNQRGLRAGAIAAGEGRERRDDDGGVGIATDVDDCGRGTSRAAELYFGMHADVGILEHVLRATATACSLHGDLKVAPWRGTGWRMRNGGVEMVMGRVDRRQLKVKRKNLTQSSQRKQGRGEDKKGMAVAYARIGDSEYRNDCCQERCTCLITFLAKT